jgi:hypothetical protein
MDLLRRRQVAEVLDEDRRINDRVYTREKEQVKEFDEVVKPKTGRDVDAEVVFDKQLEKMNAVLAVKLNAIENIFKPYGKSVDVIARNQDIVLNTSDIISNYNDLVRTLNSPTIASVSREALKAKIQEISPNINALLYGYDKLTNKVNIAGEQNASNRARLVPRLVSAYAAVAVIQKQLFTNGYTPITTSEIQVSYAKTVSELDGRVREYLAGLEGQRDLRLRPLLAGNERRMLEQRIRMIEAEKGQPLSQEEITRIRNTLFGVKEHQAEVAPGVAEELHRQDQQALEDRTAANSVVQALPDAIIPVPRRSNLGEELRRGIVESGDTTFEEQAEAMQRTLQTYLEKYDRNVGDIYTPADILADIDPLLRFTGAEMINDAEANGEEVDADEIHRVLRADYEPILLRAFPRDSMNKRRQFDRKMSALIRQYFTYYKKELRRRIDAEVERGLNQPVVGEGKPHHGLQYEEEKQEAIPAPHSRVNDEDRPDPSFFKRNHMKAHRRF